MPTPKEIFQPLHETFLAIPYREIDLLDVIAGFCLETPHIAYALSSHTRDFIESSGCTSYAEIISEGYRRTFFDEDYANKYNSAQLFNMGPQKLQDFAKYLIDGLTGDNARMAARSPMTGTPGNNDLRH